MCNNNAISLKFFFFFSSICFNIDCNSEPLWYLYDEKLGLIKTNKETLNYMLNSGWETRSQTLKEELYHKKL